MIVALLINGLWEGAVIVALSLLVLRRVPVENATTRYAAWFVALLALLVVPALTAAHLGWHILPARSLHPHAAGATFSLVALAPLADAASRWMGWPSMLPSSITLAVATLWSAGTIATLARLVVSFARIARARREAERFSQIEGFPVLVSRRLSVPIATGLFVPAIIVPDRLVHVLNSDDLRCTLEHELAHLRRGDVATNALQRLLEALLFWNPWVHLIGRRLVAEREAACDDRALERIGPSGDYACALAELGRRLSASDAPVLTPSAVPSHNALVARIERLIADRSPKKSRFNYVAIGGLVMLFAVTTLLVQMLVPPPVGATMLAPSSGPVSVAVAACKDPNALPQAIDPAPPDLPKAEFPAHIVSAIVVVTVAPSGKAVAARVYKSSGYPNVDRAVLVAAQKSTYSPKLANCIPVQGTYLFRADFKPQ